MKKKLGSLVTIMALVALVAALPLCTKLCGVDSMSGPGSLYSWAANEDGSDAHSPSMSVDSGDEPIVDESTTDAPNGDVDLEAEEEAFRAEYGDGTGDAESSDAEVDAEDSAEDTILATTEDKLLALAAGASLVVLLGIVVFITRRK